MKNKVILTINESESSDYLLYTLKLLTLEESDPKMCILIQQLSKLFLDTIIKKKKICCLGTKEFLVNQDKVYKREVQKDMGGKWFGNENLRPQQMYDMRPKIALI